MEISFVSACRCPSSTQPVRQLVLNRDSIFLATKTRQLAPSAVILPMLPLTSEYLSIIEANYINNSARLIV